MSTTLELFFDYEGVLSDGEKLFPQVDNIFSKRISHATFQVISRMDSDASYRLKHLTDNILRIHSTDDTLRFFQNEIENLRHRFIYFYSSNEVLCSKVKQLYPHFQVKHIDSKQGIQDTDLPQVKFRECKTCCDGIDQLCLLFIDETKDEDMMDKKCNWYCFIHLYNATCQVCQTTTRNIKNNGTTLHPRWICTLCVSQPQISNKPTEVEIIKCQVCQDTSDLVTTTMHSVSFSICRKHMKCLECSGTKDLIPCGTIDSPFWLCNYHNRLHDLDQFIRDERKKLTEESNSFYGCSKPDPFQKCNICQTDPDQFTRLTNTATVENPVWLCEKHGHCDICNSYSHELVQIDPEGAKTNSLRLPVYSCEKHIKCLECGLSYRTYRKGTFAYKKVHANESTNPYWICDLHKKCLLCDAEHNLIFCEVENHPVWFCTEHYYLHKSLSDADSVAGSVGSVGSLVFDDDFKEETLPSPLENEFCLPEPHISRTHLTSQTIMSDQKEEKQEENEDSILVTQVVHQSLPQLRYHHPPHLHHSPSLSPSLLPSPPPFSPSYHPPLSHSPPLSPPPPPFSPSSPPPFASSSSASSHPPLSSSSSILVAGDQTVAHKCKVCHRQLDRQTGCIAQGCLDDPEWVCSLHVSCQVCGGVEFLQNMGTSDEQRWLCHKHTDDTLFKMIVQLKDVPWEMVDDDSLVTLASLAEEYYKHNWKIPLSEKEATHIAKIMYDRNLL